MSSARGNKVMCPYHGAAEGCVDAHTKVLGPKIRLLDRSHARRGIDCGVSLARGGISSRSLMKNILETEYGNNNINFCPFAQPPWPESSGYNDPYS